MALEETKSSLRSMTTISRQQVVQFIDEVQEKCPTISDTRLGPRSGSIRQNGKR